MNNRCQRCKKELRVYQQQVHGEGTNEGHFTAGLVCTNEQCERFGIITADMSDYKRKDRANKLMESMD